MRYCLLFPRMRFKPRHDFVFSLITILIKILEKHSFRIGCTYILNKLATYIYPLCLKKQSKKQSLSEETFTGFIFWIRASSKWPLGYFFLGFKIYPDMKKLLWSYRSYLMYPIHTFWNFMLIRVSELFFLRNMVTLFFFNLLNISEAVVRRCSVKKVLLTVKHFAKCTEKHLCQNLRPVTLLKKTLALVFSCEFC